MKAVEPDSGEIAIDRSIKIEMLDQQPKFKANLSVRDAIENQLVELKVTHIQNLYQNFEFSQLRVI